MDFTAYSHLLNRADKGLVLDIGARFTKCGVMRNYSPNAIVPSIFCTANGKKLSIHDSFMACEQEWKQALEIFLKQLLFRVEGMGKDHKLIVLDSLLYPLNFRKALLYVLFQRFRVPSIKYILMEASPLCSILPNPKAMEFRRTATLVDVGFGDTRVLPVYEGVAMIGKFQHGGVSSYDVLMRLQSLLKEHGVITVHGQTKNASNCNLLNNIDTLEDILVRACFVCLRMFSPGLPPLLAFPKATKTCFGENDGKGQYIENNLTEKQLQRRNPSTSIVKEENQRVCSILYPLEDGSELEINGYIRAHAADILFENTESFPSICAKLLDTIASMEIDTKAELAHSVLFSGGICNLPGFYARLLEETEELLTTPKYTKMEALAGRLYFLSADQDSQCLPWTGASIFGSLNETGHLVEAKEFEEKQMLCLPRWEDFALQ